MTSENLWNYYRDEVNDDVIEKIDDNYRVVNEKDNNS